jgi:hypothetical protein
MQTRNVKCGRGQLSKPPPGPNPGRAWVCFYHQCRNMPVGTMKQEAANTCMLRWTSHMKTGNLGSGKLTDASRAARPRTEREFSNPGLGIGGSRKP